MAEFSANVVLGESLTPVGQLRFTHVGPRQFSTFTYFASWIDSPRGFGGRSRMRPAMTGVAADTRQN